MTPTTGAETSAFAKVQPVCNFVNNEMARLRNLTIGIAVVCAVGAVIFPLVTRIVDVRVPVVIAAGILAVWVVRLRSEVASASRVTVRRVVAALGRHLTYKPTSSLTRQHVVATDLFAGVGDGWTSRDEIGGKAGNARFSLHQVRAAGTGKVAAFEGVIIRIDFTTAFSSHTVVVPDREGPASGARSGSRVKKDLVMLRNPAFEEMFTVHSSDYHEARRIISQNVMDLLIDVAPRLGGDIRLAFVQKSAFVAVPGYVLKPHVGLFAPQLTPRMAAAKLMQLVVFAGLISETVAP